jgi:hypothetical protein
MREQPSRITQALHPGYDAVPIIDTIPQITLFVKLKLTNCARPGNRSGRFCCALVRI